VANDFVSVDENMRLHNLWVCQSTHSTIFLFFIAKLSKTSVRNAHNRGIGLTPLVRLCVCVPLGTDITPHDWFVHVDRHMNTT
jgi:hypothetical protein